MDKPGGLNVETAGLYQVGIVVRDLEKSMKHYATVLGVGPWEVMTLDDSFFVEPTYRGRPAKHRFKVALGMSGAMQIELIQPVDGESIYADFLNEHGEGLHHLGHIRVEDLPRAIKEFEKQGAPCIQGGRLPDGGGYAYMDTTASLGVITELIEIGEGPPPAYPASLWNALREEVSRTQAKSESPR